MLLDGGYYPAPVLFLEPHGSRLFDGFLASELGGLFRDAHDIDHGAVPAHLGRGSRPQFGADLALAAEYLCDRALGQFWPNAFQQRKVLAIEGRRINAKHFLDLRALGGLLLVRRFLRCGERLTLDARALRDRLLRERCVAVPRRESLQGGAVFAVERIPFDLR